MTQLRIHGLGHKSKMLQDGIFRVALPADTDEGEGLMVDGM
jgi:hypothetical protein